MDIVKAFDDINKNKINPLKNGRAYTVKELWDNVVKPLLLPKKAIEDWFEEAQKYINDPKAVFIIRTGNTRPKGDATKLRRGFLTKYKTSDISFVYADNDIATYMYKLAYDGYWTPNAKELQDALSARKIPIKFTPSCKEERAKSAYSLKGKVPNIGKSGYKVSHIIDTGTNYYIDGKVLGLANICLKYFQIGNYKDWEKGKGGYYLRILQGNIDPDALRFLKAHFLRLTCPLNYILTPKKDLQDNHSRIPKNDVGELKELQAYAMQQFKSIYGKVYDDYLDMIMLPPHTTMKSPGDKEIDVEYGPCIKGISKSSIIKTVKTAKTASKKTTKSGSGIGQYAKNIFQSLIEKGGLSPKMISNLMDKDYCSKEIGIYFPVIVINSSGTYDKQRYYKNIINGKYLICSQWYERNKARLDNWLIKNNL